tara:strand:- start:2123 stop:4063 length:1941 start_codon:yes stop_codon:yes gene_type:complete
MSEEWDMGHQLKYVQKQLENTIDLFMGGKGLIAQVTTFRDTIKDTVKGMAPLIDNLGNLQSAQQTLTNVTQIQTDAQEAANNTFDASVLSEHLIALQAIQISIEEQTEQTKEKIQTDADEIEKTRDKTHSLTQLKEELLNVHKVTKDMEKTKLQSISNSKAWTAMSRILSGSGLWALQNRIRAVIDVANIWEQSKLKAIEQDNEQIKVLKQLVDFKQKIGDTTKALIKAEDEYNAGKGDTLLQEFDSYKLMMAQGIEKKDAIKLLKEEQKALGKLRELQEKKQFGSKLDKDIAAQRAKVKLAGEKGAFDKVTGKQDPKKLAENIADYKEEQKKLRELTAEKWKQRLRFQGTRDKINDFKMRFEKAGGMKMMMAKVGQMALSALVVIAVVLSAIIIITSLISLVTEFKDGFQAVWAGFDYWLQFAFDFISGSFGVLIQGLGEIWDGILEGNIWKVLGGMLNVLFGLIGVILGGLVALFIVVVGGIATILFGLVVGMWDSTVSVGKNILRIVLMVTAITLAVGIFITFIIGMPLWLAAIATAVLVAVTVGIIKAIKKHIGFMASGGVADGLTVVGEKGPELVNLPAGSRVHSNKDSKNMVQGSSVTNNITVNVTGGMGSSDAEIRVLANKIGKMLGREINRTTNTARF